MRLIQEIKVTHTPPPMEGELHEHPAFAQIFASRISGGASLYGSDFNHQHFISIRITGSSLKRSLSSDWMHSEGEYIDVELSEAQWAHFVSSLNDGGGTACTLRRLMHETIPDLPHPASRRGQFKKEAVETCQEALDRIKELNEKISQMTISQKAKNELLSQSASIQQSLTSSLPFVLDQFGEHMEKTVEKAKVEINAYTTQAVMRAGLESLQRGDGANIVAISRT